jgi:hypothetical protein
VGERANDLPVWPILQQQGPATPVVAYAFESIDLAPLPGFAGVPFNLLVLLDAQGRFQDVRVLSQHEPVFLDGLGEAPLRAFVRQYAGLSLHQSIKIDAARPPGRRRRRRAGPHRRRGQGHGLGAHPQPDPAVGRAAGGPGPAGLCGRTRSGARGAGAQ